MGMKPPTRREILMTPVLLSVAASFQATPAKSQSAGRTLVVYMSRSGNTRVIAGQISRTLGADLFEIVTAMPYPADYLETVEQAKQERDRGVLPRLDGSVSNLDSYETVYLGFPIWGTTAPSPLKTFLSTHDLSGKTIVPFVTHGGYGLGDSLQVVARLSPRAQLNQAFVLQAPQERQTVEKVLEWLGQEGLPLQQEPI